MDLWGEIMDALSRTNPRVFELPSSIKSSFLGILTNPVNGAYVFKPEVEVWVPRLTKGNGKPNTKNRPGIGVEKEGGGKFTTLKDPLPLCWACGLPASLNNKFTLLTSSQLKESCSNPAKFQRLRESSELIQCDFCPLCWHLDCLPQPLCVPPTNTVGGIQYIEGGMALNLRLQSWGRDSLPDRHELVGGYEYLVAMRQKWMCPCHLGIIEPTDMINESGLWVDVLEDNRLIVPLDRLARILQSLKVQEISPQQQRQQQEEEEKEKEQQRQLKQINTAIPSGSGLVSPEDEHHQGNGKINDKNHFTSIGDGNDSQDKRIGTRSSQRRIKTRKSSTTSHNPSTTTNTTNTKVIIPGSKKSDQSKSNSNSGPLTPPPTRPHLRNDGNISVSTMTYPPSRIFSFGGIQYRLPERGIILDFFERCQQRGQQQAQEQQQRIVEIKEPVVSTSPSFISHISPVTTFPPSLIHHNTTTTTSTKKSSHRSTSLPPPNNPSSISMTNRYNTRKRLREVQKQ